MQARLGAATSVRAMPSAALDPTLKHSSAWFINFERARKYKNGCAQRADKLR